MAGPYTIRDVQPEWGQDVRIYDADGDLVLTVDHSHRSLAEAEEITRRVCRCLNGDLRPLLAESVEVIRRAGEDGGSYANAVGALDVLLDQICRRAGMDDLAGRAAQNRREWHARVTAGTVR